MFLTKITFGKAAAAACVGAVLWCSGCAKPDAGLRPVTAETPEEFAAWKSEAAQKIPATTMEEFESCVNDIRMGIMQRRGATGDGPIAQKLCDYINGKTMGEVIVMGHNATVA